MSRRLYAAYGSNLNFEQMKYRCPTAKLYCTGFIEEYELQFKGYPHSAFATIGEKKESFVPVSVWEIEPGDEAALDRYEGWPNHYSKQNVYVKTDKEYVTAMVYIMNPKMSYGIPSHGYYQAVKQGYADCGLDIEILEKALKDSIQKYYSEYESCIKRQSVFAALDMTAESEEDYNEELEEQEDASFTEGMHM